MTRAVPGPQLHDYAPNYPNCRQYRKTVKLGNPKVVAASPRTARSKLAQGAMNTQRKILDIKRHTGHPLTALFGIFYEASQPVPSLFSHHIPPVTCSDQYSGWEIRVCALK